MMENSLLKAFEEVSVACYLGDTADHSLLTAALGCSMTHWHQSGSSPSSQPRLGIRIHVAGGIASPASKL